MTQTFVLPPGSGLSALAPQYDVIFSDVWGVLHNGVSAWPTASEALVRYREERGRFTELRQLDEVPGLSRKVEPNANLKVGAD